MKKLLVRICLPNGFCAGVERAIQIVVLTLKKYGPPVYVRHEIVHNRFVVESLSQMGAVFIENLNEISLKHRDRPVIFSAHGVPQSVILDADQKNLFYLDATCPLVSKVHKQAIKHQRMGRHILLIGHSGHPEVIGTMGQVDKKIISLIENTHDAKTFQAPKGKELGYVTQTTLSVEDTKSILHILRQRFPNLGEPAVESICYATTNRQQAVAEAAAGCDLFFIIGSPNSSNSKRLVEVANRYGSKKNFMIQSVADINWQLVDEVDILGLSAGASAPQILLNEIINEFKVRYDISFEVIEAVKEDQSFLLPKELRDVNILLEDLAFLNGK